MKKILAAAGIGAALTAGALMGIGPAQADMFIVCPSGGEGVVGGHTSCPFADNVSRAFWASGGSNDIIAYSPVTGDRYEMICVGNYLASFDTGARRIVTHCYGGDNDSAEVVVW